MKQWRKAESLHKTHRTRRRRAVGFGERQPAHRQRERERVHPHLFHLGLAVCQAGQLFAQLPFDDGSGRIKKPSNPRHERHVHALFGEMLTELEIVRVVEEELGDDKVGARINLLLEMLPIRMLAGLAGDVPLGKSRAADAEAVLLADEFHELRRILEIRPA
jgi:hypothetical protein